MTGIPQDVLQRIRKIEIRTSRLVNTSLVGEYHSVFKGRGMEFSEVREYSPGDDIRSIDWNVTARSGAPFVKIYQEERELTVMLVVDASGSEVFGSQEMRKGEMAAEICAAVAFSAIKNNDKVGLIIFTDQIELFIPPKKGRKHVLRVIREVLFFEPRNKGTSIKQALDYLNQVIKKKSIVFLVSDFRDEGYQQTVQITSRKHDLIAVNMVDPREVTLPPVGFVQVADAETGEEVIIDTDDPVFRQKFEESTRMDLNRLRDFFARSGVDSIEIYTDRNYIDPLIHFFKLREKKLKV